MEANQNLKGTDTPDALPSSQSKTLFGTNPIDKGIDTFVDQVKANSQPTASNDADKLTERVAETYNSTGKNPS